MTASRTEECRTKCPATDARSWRVGERGRLLPRLVPVAPSDLDDVTRQGRTKILDLLARALGSERRRGRSRHWSYSLDRHVGLVRALAAEADLWRSETGTVWRADRPTEGRRGRFTTGAD